MKLKIFTFRFSESKDGFNNEPMQAFIAEEEVIEFKDHFYVHENTPYITVILSYRDISPDEKRKSHQRQDPRKELDEKEQKAYDALRAWRAAKASQEGIPPYMIANNRQIARMVKLRSESKADLVLFADEKGALWDAEKRIEEYLRDKLQLKIKCDSRLLAPVKQGLSFLGFRVFPGVIRVSRKGWRRFRRNIQQREDMYTRGEIDYEKRDRSTASLIGHLMQANTRNLRISFFQRPGTNEALTA